MKKASGVVLALLSFLGTPALADVNIEIEEGISVLAVNGSEVDSNSVFSDADTFVVSNGINQLLVQYTAEIKTSADDYELESTDTFVLLLDAEDKQLLLKAPTINTKKDVNRFNEQGNWRLLDREGNQLKLKAAILKKEGFQLARNYEHELTVFNKSGAEAALPHKRVVDDTSAPTPAPVPEIRQVDSNKALNAGKKNEVNMPEKMLRYWYNQADAETRMRFKKWIDQ